ncbi:ATP-binding protein [Kitasatospora sp. NPDC088346]|uniref:ATP-binding protein n=1 Tax=Kitasatospora sp. NPDC088346 TaxID=3364073 RepID=UPI0038025E93
MNSEITPQLAGLFASSRRGASLARRAAEQCLTEWGWPRTTDAFQAASLVVIELAANAVTHGHVPGRDFLLRLALRSDGAGAATLRVEVSDSRGERLPRPAVGPEGAESGRGLVLVRALTSQWGTVPRPPSGKTVWAEIPARSSG